MVLFYHKLSKLTIQNPKFLLKSQEKAVIIPISVMRKARNARIPFREAAVGASGQELRFCPLSELPVKAGGRALYSVF